MKVVDCRICGDPNSVLRFAFIEFTDEGSVKSENCILQLSSAIVLFIDLVHGSCVSRRCEGCSESCWDNAWILPSEGVAF